MTGLEITNILEGIAKTQTRREANLTRNILRRSGDSLVLDLSYEEARFLIQSGTGGYFGGVDTIH